MTEAQQEWERVRPWIEAALATNEFFTIEYVEDAIARGEMTLWPGKNGAAVTEFATFPKGKALNIFAVGGVNAEALEELLDVVEPCLETWARVANCKWIMGHGRPGWQRVGNSLGFKPLWNVMLKDIS